MTTDIRPRIGTHEVLVGLRKLAREKPGVYTRLDGNTTSCANFEEVDGQKVPSCIVGSFFVKELGVDIESMWKHSASNTLVDRYSDQFDFTPKAKAMLRAAQIMQDSRAITWEAVVDVVEDLVESVAHIMTSETDR